MKLLLKRLFEPKKEITLLAIYIHTFNTETFVEQLMRQGRLHEYLVKS
jgi:hypothetical protein